MRRIREVGDPVDVVIITPEPGRDKEIGQRLLALADSPADVQWVTWPQAGFSIPVELFVRFAEPDEETEETKTAPKKRGRPKKTADADDTSKEE
jgi:hypothetical protein